MVVGIPQIAIFALVEFAPRLRPILPPRLGVEVEAALDLGDEELHHLGVEGRDFAMRTLFLVKRLTSAFAGRKKVDI
jgi:hypothetical protein